MQQKMKISSLPATRLTPRPTSMVLSRFSQQQTALRSARLSAPNQCLYNPKTIRRRLHRVPKLAHDDHFKERGIGKVLSPTGYDLAWTQYQSHLVDQLNEMTGSTKDADRPTRDLLLSSARSPNHATLFNYASMAWNTHHTLTTLSPDPAPMSEAFSSRLSSSFSSPISFRATFLATASGMFGPGFVWLLKSNTAAPNNAANDPELTILCTYNAGSPLPGAHYRRQDTDMNTQPSEIDIDSSGNNSSSSGSTNQMALNRIRAGSFGPNSGSLDSRIGRGGSSHEVLLGVCTWQHFWLQDWGVTGKRRYLEAWWDSVDWATVERNGVFDKPALRRRGSVGVGLPGVMGRMF